MPDAGRVITGLARGRRLASPGPATRALSDKVKQALFSLLESARPDVWQQPMLDLFAGSGAAGIEALSRGAPAAVLVERDARAAGVTRRNLERAGLSASGRVERKDVLAYLARGARGVVEAPFGSVVLDPPYSQPGALAASLERLGEPDAGWLDADAIVVAKHFWRDVPPGRCGDLVRLRTRRFGETALSVYRREHVHAAGGE